MWRNIWNRGRFRCVGNPKNDMDKQLWTQKKSICSYEPSSIGTDIGKSLLTGIKWRSQNQMYFCSKASTPSKEKQYLTLFSVVMKYQTVAWNSRDYASVRLTSVAKAFWHSWRIQRRRGFLKKPLGVVFAEIWAVTSVRCFSGKQWWKPVTPHSLWGSPGQASSNAPRASLCCMAAPICLQSTLNLHV